MLSRCAVALREGRARGSGEPWASVDVVYVLVGIAVPFFTFVGVWGWRMHKGTAHQPPDAAERDAALARSLSALTARLDEVRDQISGWSRDLEERDRKLAAHISGLIDVTEKAARTSPEAKDPREAQRGGV
jgi:hypothetical protein